MRRRAALLLVTLLACKPPPSTEPPPPPAELAVAAPAAPPPPPAPASTIVREAVALQPGEQVAPLAVDGSTAVDPSATFRVVLTGPSPDARLALHDAADAAVPSSVRAEVGDTTLLTLAPAAPLAPGARYQLRLDGAVTRELHSGDRTFTPVAFALAVAGEPPSPARPAKRKLPRRR